MTDKDPYIGETYADKDSRSSYRRIRITGFDQERGKYRGIEWYGGQESGPARYYKASTLDTRYRKISH